MPLEIVKLGASRLSASGLPVVTATNQVGNADADLEHFGEVDHFNGLGITARPFPANDTGHAEALVDRGVAGTTGVALSGRDERCADAYALLNPGDTCQHATGPKHGAMLLTREDGRVTMLTSEDGTVTGRTVFAEVGSDGHRWVGPWGKVTFDAAGFHMLHHTGARIDLGGIGGLPSPLDAMGAYASIAAPLIKLEGSLIRLGGAGAADAVAKASPTVAILGSIGSALTAIAAALVNLDAGLLVAGSASATVAPAGQAIIAAVTAIGSALETIPSSSTTVT